MNAAVLDCFSRRNVMGKVWKDTFIASLGPNERNEVVSLPGGTSFNFGGGTKTGLYQGFFVWGKSILKKFFEPRGDEKKTF